MNYSFVAFILGGCVAAHVKVTHVCLQYCYLVFALQILFNLSKPSGIGM